MAVISIAIVEDDPACMEQLADYIQRFRAEKGISVRITQFQDGEDISEEYHPGFDIILMDIQMRFRDGMTAARMIREKDSSVIIIFITSLAGYAIQGYEVEALDYILKPLTYDMFFRKMERAMRHLKTDRDDYLVVNAGEEGSVRLKLSDICYIESRSHVMDFHTPERVYTSRGRLEDLEMSLTGKGFFRCNRGYLINLYTVDGVRKDCVLVAGDLLPISRRRKAELMQRLAEIL